MEEIKPRSIVIGDVHGCLRELDELLAFVQHTSADRLILAGDLIDRGPDSVGVVRRAMDLHAEAVKGNHEEFHLRFRKHQAAHALTGKKNPMAARMDGDDFRKTQHEMPSMAWDWLESLPNYLHIDTRWSVVHAGCMPDVAVEEQHSNHLWRLRHVERATGKMANLNDAKNARTHAHWTEGWHGPRSILYGHDAKRGGPFATATTRRSVAGAASLSEFYEASSWTMPPSTDVVCTLGIDTACVYGDKLTAAVFVKPDEDGRYTEIEIRSVLASGAWARLRDEESGP